ncbi:hypothetical protein MASR2M17_10400 [Aminivibrio sp.]
MEDERLPATRLNLQKKGFIREGMDADLSCSPRYRPGRSDLENPFGEPRNFHVFVGGRLAVKDGVSTGAAAGKVLRKG